MKINFKPSENITHWLIYYVATMLGFIILVPMLVK